MTVISGHAARFGLIDLGRDVVMPGAFRASLARRGTGGIKMLLQHDPKLVVGNWSFLEEDSEGLFVRGTIDVGTARGPEIAALLEDGRLPGLSIGYRTVRATTDTEHGVRRLVEVDLWEVSLVAFPMQPEARLVVETIAA